MEGKGLAPCVYIIRGKQKHLDRLIIVFAKLKAWNNNFKLGFSMQRLTMYSAATTVAIFQKMLFGAFTREKNTLCKKMRVKEWGGCLLKGGVFSRAYSSYPNSELPSLSIM